MTFPTPAKAYAISAKGAVAAIDGEDGVVISRGGRGTFAGQGGITVLPDSAHPAVYVLQASTGYTVSLADLKLPKEPFLFVRAIGSLELPVGVPASITLTKQTPKLNITLASGPKNLTLSGDTIRWTPQAGDVGESKVSLKISAAGFERKQELMLTARRASMTVPFIASGLQLTPSGKRAVIFWSPGFVSGPPFVAPPGNGQQEDSRVALLDLETLKVLADRRLAANFRMAAVDEERVFLGASDSDAVYVLSTKDLSDVKRIFLPYLVQQLYSTGTKFFADSNMFDLPSLEALITFKIDPVLRAPDINAKRSYPNPQPDGVARKGVVYDLSLTRARLVYAVNMGIPMLGDLSQIPAMEDSNAIPPSYWGVAARDFTHRFEGRRIIGDMSPAITLADVPAKIELRNSILPRNVAGGGFGPGGVVNTVREELIVTDLVTKQQAATIALSQQTLPVEAPRNNNVLLDAQGGRIGALVGDHVFVLSAKDILAAAPALNTPVYFEPDQSAIDLQPGKIAQLIYKAHGGKPPLKYALAADAEGLSIDASTGTVNVDPSKVTEKVGTVLMATFRGSRDLSMDTYITNVKQLYRDMMGRDPTGFPVAIRISVMASDAEPQRATLRHFVFIQLNPSDVRDIYANFQAEAALAATRAIAAKPATMPAEEALRKRISELERQVQDLEAQNRLLRDLVTGRGPATKP